MVRARPHVAGRKGGSVGGVQEEVSSGGGAGARRAVVVAVLLVVLAYAAGVVWVFGGQETPSNRTKPLTDRTTCQKSDLNLDTVF